MVQNIHLNDLIKDITGIVLYNNINDAHILSSTQLKEGVDDVEDSFKQTCIYISDNQLKTISDEDLHKITNIELLDRLAKICKDRLSVEQIKLLEESYNKKIAIDTEDIQYLLNCIKKIKNIYIEDNYKKELLEKYNLNYKDILNILNTMTIDDYYGYEEYINLNHNLIMFKTIKALNNKRYRFDIYLKFDINMDTGDTVLRISIKSDGKEVDENGYTEEEVENILKVSKGPLEKISFEDLCKL